MLHAACSSARQRSRPASLSALAALGALSLLVGACGRDERGPYPMEPGRTRESPDREVPPGATARDRLPVLGLDGRPLGSSASPTQPPPLIAPGRPTFTLPPGWEEQSAGPMRVLSLRIPGDAGGEAGDLSVSRAGGDVAGNVNRWRGQVGLEPLEDEALAALPRQDLLGAPAVRVEGRGPYDAGMGGGGPKTGYALLGLVSTAPGAERWFVKLVGPEALVEAQRAAFDTFVASLALPPPPSPTAPAPAPLPAPAPAPVPAPAPPATPGAEAGFDPAKLGWTLPSGWQAVKPTRMMRLSEFRIEGASALECVLSHLAGEGGGLALNVNRWRGQLGQSPLSEAEIAALERLDMLGRKAVWIEIPGRYQGMSGEDVPEALFVGVVCLLEKDALFVRLVGPKAEVEPQREALRALCRSLRVGP